MGFFSKLFGLNRKSADSIEPVTTAEVDQVFDDVPQSDLTPIIIDPVVPVEVKEVEKDELKKSSPKKTTSKSSTTKNSTTTTKKSTSTKKATTKKSNPVVKDFNCEVITKKGNKAQVKVTANGTDGKREYIRDFDTIDDANNFIAETTTKVMNWVKNGKTLYQTMSYLKLTRIS